MLYTVVSADGPTDRIRLYPSPVAAREAARGERPVAALAMDLDPWGRRVVPATIPLRDVDPTWSAPVELHADGSATARGPIPEALFLDCPTLRPVMGLGLGTNGTTTYTG